MSQNGSRKKIAARLWRPVLGVIGLVIIIAWAGGFFTAKVPPGTVSHEPGSPLKKGTKLYTVIPEMITPGIDIVGTVTSEEKIHLSARIPAYVKKLFVSAGDPVTKGQVLVTLDDREIQEQLRAAQSRFRQAEIEHIRTKGLFQKAAATEQALVAAESMYISSRANVEGVKVMLTYTKITSPITGLVTDRRIEAGDLANPGEVLLAVYDPLRMRLVAPVPVRLIKKLTVKKEVNVTLEHPDRIYSGMVTEIVSEVDPKSRTQLVKVHLNVEKGEVLPGIFGRLWVEEDERTATVVPASAVYRVGQLEMVQVTEEGRVVPRLVKTGLNLGDRVEILSGLREGETILVHPQTKE
jgi:RND family efflux transporter MFP subunit